MQQETIIRFREFLLLVLISFSLFGGSWGTVRAEFQAKPDNSIWKQRFLQEAPTRWKEYSQRAQALQGSFSFQLSQTLGNLLAQNLYEIKKNDGRILIFLTKERTRGGKRSGKTYEVFGLNPDYGFILSRKDSSSPWVLKELGLKGESLSDFKSKNSYFEDEVYAFINDLVRVDRESLVDIVQKPEFQVRHCQAVPLAGEEMVEVTFDYIHEAKPGDNPVQGGTLLLDPQRFWCLRSYEVRLKSDRLQGTMKYQVLELGESAGLPVPQRAVTKAQVVFDGQKNEQTWKFEYDLSAPRQLPSKDNFTLTAFGLPEPPGLEWKRPTPWYLWVGLAGIVCLVLGVGGRWLKQRMTVSRR